MSDYTVEQEGEALKLYLMERFNRTEAEAIHIIEMKQAQARAKGEQAR